MHGVQAGWLLMASFSMGALLSSTDCGGLRVSFKTWPQLGSSSDLSVVPGQTADIWTDHVTPSALLVAHRSDLSPNTAYMADSATQYPATDALPADLAAALFGSDAMGVLAGRPDGMLYASGFSIQGSFSPSRCIASLQSPIVAIAAVRIGSNRMSKTANTVIVVS
ncbi:hypothetical protein BC831DRAFT_155981 [Entophlyctis helioformis]|nr:hypothetical protein BC831DRAFT_155981 [Entophlyctis helioformis]